MAHRDFDAARAEKHREPVTFTMGGQQFTCLTRIPSDSMLSLVDAYEGVGDADFSKPDAQADPAVVAKIGKLVLVLRQFLFAVLDKDSAERFRVLLEDHDNGPDFDEIQDLVLWLQEEIVGRPTGPSQDSPPLHSNGGENSTGLSGSERAIDSMTLPTPATS